jgi:hypothetical protein
MIASVVVQNLLYTVGAVVLAVIGGIIVTLRHRKPKSVEANMASFHKGLRALAPDAEPVRRQKSPLPSALVPQARTVHTVLPTPKPPVGDGPPTADTGPDTLPHGDNTTEAETG